MPGKGPIIFRDLVGKLQVLKLECEMALLQHVAKDPAAYAEPRPLSRAFAKVPDMPAD